MNDKLIRFEPAEFPIIDSFPIDSASYNGGWFYSEDTKFLIFGKKENGIGVDRLQQAVLATWPKWVAYFPVKTSPITIVETDWGLGGGSLGQFLLAIHLRGEYDETSSAYLESILGWPPAPTGLAYIEKQFSAFVDPLQAYVNDQVAHELGHIFFLHGIGDVKSEADIWFGLGLGLVYDRLIWKDLAGTTSPVFDAFERTWKERFANNPEIDQRLINPITKNDEKFGLIRLPILRSRQSFGLSFYFTTKDRALIVSTSV